MSHLLQCLHACVWAEGAEADVCVRLLILPAPLHTRVHAARAHITPNHPYRQHEKKLKKKKTTFEQQRWLAVENRMKNMQICRREHAQRDSETEGAARHSGPGAREGSISLPAACWPCQTFASVECACAYACVMWVCIALSPPGGSTPPSLLFLLKYSQPLNQFIPLTHSFLPPLSPLSSPTQTREYTSAAPCKN